MKKILVTGASGFIGRYALQPLLDRGYEVHAVARTPLAGLKNIHWHAADLLDMSQARRLIAGLRASHLLHFAWYAEHGKFWNASENHAWVDASKNLLRSFIENGGSRFVGAGTCAEYDWSAGHCVENQTPLRPGNTYGICKDEFRQHLEDVARDCGLSAAWGRIFHLYGPGEHPARLAASVILALIHGDEARCSQGLQLRDFMHVEDAGNAFAALSHSDVTGAVNIGSGRPVEIRTLATTIAERVGRPDLLKLGALPTRPGDPAILTAETQRLNDEVSWRGARSLEVGIGQTIDWWQRATEAGTNTP